MRKRGLLELLLMLSAVCLCRAAEIEKIGIRFERSGSDASSVKVCVVDAEGHTIEGLTTSLTCSHSLKTAGTGITSAIVCPDVNATTSPDINLTLRIEGLPASLRFSEMGLDIHALNGSGAYQSNTDGKTRQFDVTVRCGGDAGATTDFATLRDVDIAAGVGQEGAVHKYWALTSQTEQTAEGTLVLSINVTKGTENMGCFFALSGITVGGTDEIVETEPAEPGDDTVPRADAVYYITWFSDASQYMTETATGALVVGGEDRTERQFWEFVPTGRDNCYYVRNTATGHYIQSCNLTASSASKIQTGTTPVEYYVERNTTAGASVNGYFRLTSTDCANYDNTAGTPLGLNKDGASTSIIAWHAGNTNTGSYWMLTATDNRYELRPFIPSTAIGAPGYKYTLCHKDGRVLTRNDDGHLTWQDETYDDRQAWYFVGESNHTEGYCIVNAAGHATLDVAGESDTRWCVMSDAAAGTAYYFRPFARRNEAGAALSVDGDSLMQVRLLRSDFARSAQIYNQPCGMRSTNYLSQASVDGAGVLAPLVYPMPVLSGGKVTQPAATAPSAWHTIYTQSKATFAVGHSIDLAFTLHAAPSPEEQAWVYFDWNRDGIFETAYELTIAQTMQLKVDVPALAKEGRSRMRFRLTANGLPDAEDDVDGQTVDFILNVTNEMPEIYPVSVRSNDPERGTAELQDSADELPHVAVATPTGNASFLCWKEAGRIVSADRIYDFVRDHAIELVACFSPNTQTLDGIRGEMVDETGFIVDITSQNGLLKVKANAPVLQTRVYSAAGALVARADGNRVKVQGLPAGTYIVKVMTAGKGASVKVNLR